MIYAVDSVIHFLDNSLNHLPRNSFCLSAHAHKSSTWSLCQFHCLTLKNHSFSCSKLQPWFSFKQEVKQISQEKMHLNKNIRSNWLRVQDSNLYHKSVNEIFCWIRHRQRHVLALATQNDDFFLICLWTKSADLRTLLAQ